MTVPSRSSYHYRKKPGLVTKLYMMASLGKGKRVKLDQWGLRSCGLLAPKLGNQSRFELDKCPHLRAGYIQQHVSSREGCYTPKGGSSVLPEYP